ncbi:MAG: SBBP repeat-containing protein [Bacteroidia bacterium]
MKKQLHTAILIAIFASLGLNKTANAQAPGWQWAKASVGSSVEYAQSVAADGSGNVVITGRFQSPTLNFGTFALTHSGTGGTDDMYVVKYDAAGNVLWAHSATGPGNDIGNGISADAAGNVYVIGNYNGTSITFGTIVLTNANPNSTNDVFIVKYSSSGAVVWAKSIGGTASDAGNSIYTDAGGNSLITGGFESTSMALGTTTLTNPGFFIAKCDVSGNVLWANGITATGTGTSTGLGVSADVNGNALVTGAFNNYTITFGSGVLTNSVATGATSDIFVAKYDGAGNSLWAQAGNGTGVDKGQGISSDASGNVYITGSIGSNPTTFGTTTINNVGYSNIFIAKYDASGTSLWVKRAGGTSYDYGFGIVTDAAGNSYITGSYDTQFMFGTTTVINAGASDIYVAKYDASGTVLWVTTSTGGPSNELCTGIALNSSGNLFVTGSYVSSSVSLGTNTLTTTGTREVLTAKLNSTTGIEENSINDKMSMFPNPFISSITILFSEEQTNTTLKITDILGKEIRAINFTGKQLTIDREEMKGGVYFLQAIDEKKNLSNRKIVIQ